MCVGTDKNKKKCVMGKGEEIEKWAIHRRKIEGDAIGKEDKAPLTK